jgi:hypothetical protein
MATPMSFAFVCRNAAGKWSVVPTKHATIPPFEMVDGPYHFEEAIRVSNERNQHRSRRLHRNGDDFRSDLL